MATCRERTDHLTHLGGSNLLAQDLRNRHLAIASPYDLEHWALVPRVEGRQSALRISCRTSRDDASERYVRRELLSANVSIPIRITSHGKRKGASDAV